MSLQYEKELAIQSTNIPGLLVLDLSVHGDNRGWFKENWQQKKMCDLGLPDFKPVQQNMSFNMTRGVTRGIHAEPWDKLISVACGSVFGAWVDLRPGASFGQVFTATVDASKAIYVPRGVGNSFQALEDKTVYSYLVNAHWSAELKSTYTFVNLRDPALNIKWPIPLDDCEISDADKCHPLLSDVSPMLPRRTLVTGCNGQLGRAIKALVERRNLSCFDYTDIDDFDFSNPSAYEAIDWSLYGTVINCGAYTAVDKAETSEGRIACWKANASGPALLAKICNKHNITLVHISSDYVFDGVNKVHSESEELSPLSVYGQSKAAGDIAVTQLAKYYIVRSSWVVGDGHNFVKTMASLSDRVADKLDNLKEVSVVNDQIGRLSFTNDIASAIVFLLGYREDDLEPSHPAPYGIYNVTSSGKPVSWAEIARSIFKQRNNNEEAIRFVSTEAYYFVSQNAVAPRPHFSTLNLSKIKSLGWTPSNWEDRLRSYLTDLYM